MVPLHWREYLMEAAELAVFMVSACVFCVLLEHPASPIHQSIPNAVVRRALMGVAMGTTAVTLIRSPWGQRSGAHLNPAVTLTFWLLGKVSPRDAAFYALFQFAGAIAGVLAATAVLGPRFVADPRVNFVATLPGPGVPTSAAFLAEVLMTFFLMTVVLSVSNRPNLARYTPYCAGTLVALFITLEAPISGMSMNPARTFGSAIWIPGQTLRSLWIYFTAPPLGMLAAAALYKALPGARRVYCAKFHHHNNQPCIFRCNFGEIA